jgi:hypothetical protein
MVIGRRERGVQILLVIWLFVSYAYFLPRRVDWNQNGRMDMILAVVDQGRLEIDDYYGNTGDYARFGEHYYSDKAPGTALLGIPFYWAFRTLARAPIIGDALERVAAGAGGRGAAPGPASPQEEAGLFPWRGYFALALYAATLGAVALPSALLGGLLYRLARRLGAGVGGAAILTLVYGLGTGAFPYGSALYGHMPAAFCLFAAFYILFSQQEGEPAPWRLALVGLLLGWAIITEYPMALPAAVIGLYAIYELSNRRRLLWIVAGGLAPMLILVALDMAAYGTPLPVGYWYSELWQEEHSIGFMSLTAPSLARLWGITFSPYRGLFFLSPALLLVVPGLMAWWSTRQRRAGWVALMGVIIVLVLFNASSAMWWGGYAVGPRYMLPAVPFMALPIASWLGSIRWRYGLLAGMGGLSALSVWTQTITSLTFYPPEAYRFPLLELSWPLLKQGRIAANLGHALGLEGAASLWPLALAFLLMGGALWAFVRRAGAEAT